MRAAKRLLVLFALIFAARVASASEFDAANQLYDAGKYGEARVAYERLMEHGTWSANLFYNLGNTLQRVGEKGPAILAYERALLLDPRHADAAANRQLVRGQTGARSWSEDWRETVFPARWLTLTVVLGAAAGWSVVAIVCWIAVTPPGDKAGRWFLAALAVLVAAYAGAAIWNAERSRAAAIIVASSAEARVAPAETAASTDVLPAGTEVRVLSVRGDWTYCSLPGQRRGWVSSRSLERVRLGQS